MMKYFNHILILFVFCFFSQLTHALEREEAINKAPSEFPSRLYTVLDAQPYWQKGYLDVTKPPYNAVGDGTTDDTVAIQNAMDDAFKSNLVAFFPGNKVYLVSGPLRAIKTEISRRNGYALEGSTQGTKPVIKLADNSDLDGSLLTFATFVDGDEGAPYAYNNFLRGIDIDLGNNPLATGVSMNGNQYNMVQNVKVSGSNFFAGFMNIPGCGGGMLNVSVIGGQYGIYQREYRPEPTVFGLYLENQSEAGVFLTQSRGPLILAGFKIVSPENPTDSYRAIYANNRRGDEDFGRIYHSRANLVLYDGSIEIRGNNTNLLAIENRAQDLSITNVYFKAKTLIQSGTEKYTGSTKLTESDPQKWSLLPKYLFTSSLDQATVFFDNQSQNDGTQDYVYELPLTVSDSAPTTDFLTLHTWDSAPSWEDNNIVDVVVDFGATPAIDNATDDDGVKIQAAIDAVTTVGNEHYGKTVFIPRGYFHINKTLILKDGLTMIGSQKLNSAIMPLWDWPNSLGPVVATENSSVGGIYLSEFGIINNASQKAAHFRANNMFIKDLGTERVFASTNPEDSPLYLFSDNIGGKIYNLSLGSVPTKSPYGLPPKPNYYVIQVKNTTNPLTFYHVNVAHVPSSPQVSISNAKNVLFLGFKYEFEHELMHITDSKNIKLYGASGIYQLKIESDEAIFVIKNSEDIVLENLDRKNAIDSVIETNWVKVEDTYIDGDHALLYFAIAANTNPGNLADFSADSTFVATEEVVSFTDLSNHNPTSWSWEFEGGTPATSTEKNPTVVYDRPGFFNVKLTSTSDSGSFVATKEAYITVTKGTNVLPTVSILSPLNNARYEKGKSVTIEAEAADADGDILYVDFYVNDELLGRKNTPPYNNWDLVLTEGANELTAVATDNEGGKTTSEPVTVYGIDPNNQAPTVTITNPADGEQFAGGSLITIRAEAQDTDGEINNVEFFVNGESVRIATGSFYKVVDWMVPVGASHIKAVATDNGGAQSVAEVTVYGLSGNNEKPTVAFQNPVDNRTIDVGKLVKIEAIAADSDGEIAQVELIADGVSLAVIKGNDGPYRYPEWPVTSGIHTLTAIATDNEGDTATETITVFGFDPNNILPQIQLTNISDGDVLIAGSLFTIRAEAQDSDGEIDNVEFFINDESVHKATGSFYKLVDWQVPIGASRVRVVATDNDGGQAEQEVTIYGESANNQMPVVTFQNPTDNRTIDAGKLVKIEVTAVDPDGEIAQVELLANGESLIVITGNEGPYRYFNWPVTLGVHEITAIAVDNEGAKTTEKITVFGATETNLSPSVYIRTPSDGKERVAGDTLKIEAIAQDEDGAIYEVEYFVNGESIGVINKEGDPDAYPLFGWEVGLGSFEIYAVATDNEGAKTTSSMITITGVASATTLSEESSGGGGAIHYLAQLVLLLLVLFRLRAGRQ